MILKDLIQDIVPEEVLGDLEQEIKGLAIDSRKARPGFLFFAVSGTKQDGHSFIDDALTRGATAVICENIPENTHVGVTYIKVKNTSDVVGTLASKFFDNPTNKIKVVGVTGTNGKTTIATMLYNLFKALGCKGGLLSTIENKIDDEILLATHTTGDAIELQENLSKMIEAKCEYVFMEVSSHAAVQKRIKGINFAGGIFTNLTQDHLDYHKDLKEYSEAKKIFFEALPPQAFALYNEDDAYGEFMVANIRAKKYSYGEHSLDFPFSIAKMSADGLQLKIKDSEVSSPLVGKFNAYNLAAIFSAATLLGIAPEKVSAALGEVSGARGRMEKVVGKSGVIGIVDYSHTPDALKNALETINNFKGDKKVITVFGAGGDRDKTKRPIMGEIAASLSDFTIVTSDNPRSENPSTIIEDILSGIKDGKNIETEVDRSNAIQKAITLANVGDIVLVAGKGHEDYQEIAGVKTHFSDKETLEKFL